MINQIFDESFIAASLDDKSPLVHWLEVDRAIRSVRIECSDYKGPFPDFTLSDVARNKMLTFQNKYRRPLVLEKVLQTALGGSSYIASGLMTRHGHHVGINKVNLQYQIFIRVIAYFMSLRSRASDETRWFPCCYKLEFISRGDVALC